MVGTRLLPTVLEDRAINEPPKIYALLPHSSDIIAGFFEITMKQMSHAVDITA